MLSRSRLAMYSQVLAQSLLHARQVRTLTATPARHVLRDPCAQAPILEPSPVPLDTTQQVPATLSAISARQALSVRVVRPSQTALLASSRLAQPPDAPHVLKVTNVRQHLAYLSYALPELEQVLAPRRALSQRTAKLSRVFMSVQLEPVRQVTTFWFKMVCPLSVGLAHQDTTVPRPARHPSHANQAGTRPLTQRPRPAQFAPLEALALSQTQSLIPVQLELRRQHKLKLHVLT